MKVIRWMFVITISLFLFACNHTTATSQTTTTNENISTENEDSIFIQSLNSLLDSYFSTNYYSYSSSLEMLFINNQDFFYSFTSDVDVFYDPEDSSNMFHLYSEKDDSIASSSTITCDDTYYYYDEYGVNIATKRDYITSFYYNPSSEPKWETSFLSYEEQRSEGLLRKIDLFDLKGVMNGVYDLDYTEGDTYYDFTIPLSENNFSFLMFPDVKAFFDSYYLFNSFESNELLEMFTDRLGLLDLEIRVDKNFTDILNVSLDMTALINDFAKAGFDEVYMDIFQTVNIQFFDWSNSVIEFDSPFSNNDYTDNDYLFFDIDGDVNDAYIDTVNKTVVYSITGDNNLYIFNYLTNEKEKIYFDIKPDQITGNGEYIYVTLSDLHIRSTVKPEYGGVAVINATDLADYDVYSLDFDPYDISVDKDGYLYITPGSDQHADLRGFDPKTGAIVSDNTSGYYLNQIIYSIYSNHLYYADIMTTYDNLAIYAIDMGNYFTKYIGDEDFTEKNLTLTPDGKYLYSLDGKIFALDPDIQKDGFITDDLGFSYQSVAFDPDNGITYFAMSDGICAMDSDKVFTETYKYAMSSIRMSYDEGLLINVGGSHIEIIDTTGGLGHTIIAYATINYSSDFDYANYFLTNGFSSYIPYQLSGNIGSHELGSYDFVYSLTKGDLVYYYYLVVNMVDVEAPVITLDDEISQELALGQDFTPPIATVTDNFDEDLECTVFSNNVDTYKLGLYTITYQATDSSGNVAYESFDFSVGLADLSYDIESHVFSGNISDAVYSIPDNALFYALPDSKQVIRYDFDSGNLIALSFDNTPERLLLYEGKVYVTITHQEHDMCWNYEEQSGDIAIINASTGTLESVNPVTVDPYSIVIIDGYIYISPGSGQFVPLVSYKLSDFTERNELLSEYLPYMSELATYPDSNYIFIEAKMLSPQQLYKLTVSKGRFVTFVRNPDDVYVTYGDKIFPSYDGSYVFSACGKAYYQENSGDFTALSYAYNLTFTIDAYCYSSTRTIYGNADGDIYWTDANSLIVAYKFNTGYSVNEIYGDIAKLYMISYTEDGLVFLIANMTN